jgi:nucleoside-diphosphate-sugar epimerase
MKTALVLGSSGFIGGHLVKSLIEDGYWVVGVDVRKVRYTIFNPSKFILGDLRNANFVESLFDIKYDEVYQLAADMGGATYINCGDYDGSVMSNSVIINSNIAKSCSKYGVGKLFFSSSACVYPHNNDDVATCKEEDAYPSFPDNEYGWEKLFSERMYKGFERQYKLNVFIARFHSIVGDYAVWDNDRSKAHSALALKIAQVPENGEIEVIGDGTQIRTFLYVADCISAIRALINSNCKEVLNIGSDECITINQYIDILKTISGKNFNIKYIDGPTGVKYRYCNIDKIKELCNWKPVTSVEESARITYNFILDQLNNKPRVLFISQKVGCINDPSNSYCGIGLRGELTSKILTSIPSNKYNFIREFVDNNNDLDVAIQKHYPNIIIYNYHSGATPWLNDQSIRLKYNTIKHIMIHYDLLQIHIDNFNPSNFVGFNYIITDNDTLNTNNTSIFLVPRSIPFSDKISIENRIDTIPKIGFQGFGFGHKGIDKIARQIQNEFDEAIFRLHMPSSYFCDRHGNEAKKRVSEVCSIITKPGIKIEVSHDFLSDEDIIKWLNENTINCYFYDYLPNSGIASSPDYAIAARRPIAVNNSRMLTNLHNLTPSIEIEKTSLKDIINNGITPLLPIYEKYKQENVVRRYEDICDILLK